jgi:hypothetical protein
MKFCGNCRTGVKRQIHKICPECGDKLVDVPVNSCNCGFKPKAHHAFCIKCGEKLERKEVVVA